MCEDSELNRERNTPNEIPKGCYNAILIVFLILALMIVIPIIRTHKVSLKNNCYEQLYLTPFYNVHPDSTTEELINNLGAPKSTEVEKEGIYYLIHYKYQNSFGKYNVVVDVDEDEVAVIYFTPSIPISYKEFFKSNIGEISVFKNKINIFCNGKKKMFLNIKNDKITKVDWRWH